MRLEGIRRIANGTSAIDFTGRRRTWLAISGLVLLASTLGLTVRKLNLGLEFEGGTSFTVPLERAAGVADIRSALAPFGLSSVSVQISTNRTTGSREALVRSPHIDETARLSDVRAALAEVAGLPTPDAVNFTDVGPTWGRQISTKALRGLLVFLVLVVIYISLRFEPAMAFAALAALFHDLVATAGVYALVGFEVTPATVIALLTLLGYSLYDTVVVFDRVKENAEVMTTGRSGASYGVVVNRSVNEVLMRSINTSLTSLLPVGALLFVGAFLFGATTLKDLALALFVGVLVGTYSSLGVASPLLAWWKDRRPRTSRARPSRVPTRATVKTETAPAPPSPPATRPPLPARRPGTSRPRRRKRGKRRR